MESDIKHKICDWLDSAGFYTTLNVVTNRNGFPDVTVYCPGGRVFLLETKQPGKEMKALQKYRRDEIYKKVQAKAFRVDCLEQVKKIIEDGSYLFDQSK